MPFAVALNKIGPDLIEHAPDFRAIQRGPDGLVAFGGVKIKMDSEETLRRG
jgi:hypothetical protein